VAHPAADAEVGEQEVAVLVDEHVVGLDVLVNDGRVAGVEVGQGVRELGQQRGGFLFRKVLPPLSSDATEPLEQ
jgi:hypothetical protein